MNTVNWDTKMNYESRRTVVYDEDADTTGHVNKYHAHNNDIQWKDTLGNSHSISANPQLTSHSHVFQNLLKTDTVITDHVICSMMMSYDSTRIISVQKKDNHESYVAQHCMVEKTKVFYEKFGGHKESYIKIKEVAQNSSGTMFAACYMDNGKFRMRIFGKEQRTKKEISSSEIKFNELFGLSNYSMPIDGFPDPFINCCFIDDDQIFVNFFHNYSLTHYHLIWNIKSRRVTGKSKGVALNHHPISYKFPDSSNSKNFPYKCFYSSKYGEVYVFYRQGEVLTINAKSLKVLRFEKITDMELGQMEMIFDEALVCRSSSKILFFKQVWDYGTDQYQWSLYHSIKNIRGFVYFIRGNVRIQITNNEFIYFYLINRDDLMPVLENVMYNYMNCNQMMIGAMKKYSITYKTNQRNFEVYQRKYLHNLRVIVRDGNFECSQGIEIMTSNQILVSTTDKVMILDNETYEQVGTLPVTLLKTETREPNMVIGIQKSVDEEFVAVVTGKNLVMDEQKQNQLYVFTRQKRINDFTYDDYSLVRKIVIKDIKHFK